MRVGRLVKAVGQFHANVERDDQKRQERMARERIQALKADDEEAYLKLVSQQKDTRISFLLKQTDEHLASLTQLVREQQNELGEIEEEKEEEYLGDESRANYYGTAHRVQENVVEQPSILIGGRLKDYQLKGLQWMVSLYNNHLNGILADQMGLGKTIQTISLIAYLMEVKRQNGPFLIIVPLSTMTNWSLEFQKWAPSIKKVDYKGSPNVRKGLQGEIRKMNPNVIITTFEYIIKDRQFLSRIKWLYMIVDEGHRMKNAQSKLSSTIGQYYSTKYRLILTGTPLQNNLPELWSLLNFVLPKVFSSIKSFDEWFNAPFENTGERLELNEEETLLIIRRLHKVLRPFLLRRLKKDVESELPDKVERIIKCKLSALQINLYESIKQKSSLEKKVGFRKLNNTIMQLRKICNHPFVFNEVESQMNPHKVNNELLYRTSGKFELLRRILPKFQASNHKVLIFFQMTQIMTIMEDLLNMIGIKYLRLDGSTKSEDRTKCLELFNKSDEFSVFLLSTRAGGLGLNLQSSDTVIIFDSDWNPHQDLQAQDRAHRIGQTKQVRIFRLVTSNSIEEVILAKAQYKLNLDGKIIQAGKFDNKSTNEEREAMLRSLLDSERNNNNSEDIFDDDELNDIIARNDSELDLFKRIDKERNEFDKQTWNFNGDKPRLIGQDELPQVLLNIPEEQPQTNDLLDYNNGRRKRKTISYDENNDDPFDSNPTESAIESQQGSYVIDTPQGIESQQGLDNEFQPSKVASDFNNPRDLFYAINADLYASIDSFSGHRRIDPFIILPNASDYPDYYEIIKNPICLSDIKYKADNNLYSSFDSLKSDLCLLFDNAQIYNQDGSIIFDDSVALKNIVLKYFPTKLKLKIK
ncbi:SNF2-related domain-containing protein [Rozella allomycis CSF55]|uniref:SNF2-related domain-containing protein n=1 Tax=Rozella allomycis (strain CSF55) TaxID=988480 RepID=A0A075B3Q6_ROZAC|nr:SNF2-related domain-containing protein [Rozella allomycis CSF55]|eukprot:EPZ37057.1 SNF2-related domain-containing protein [Rozella allomycis CSF55]